jgi:hypothetical protein
MMTINPAAAVAGQSLCGQERRNAGARGADRRKLLAPIAATTLRDSRDRALIAALSYSFARISRAPRVKVENLRPRGTRWTAKLQEKDGKRHAMPCHRALAEALPA